MILAKFSFSPNGKCPTSLNDKLLERNHAPNHSVEIQIGGHFQRRRIWFVYVFPRKHTASKEKSVLGGEKSKLRFTGMATASATGEKLPMFVIGANQKNLATLRTSNISLANTHHKRKVGWIVKYLKTGSGNWTKSFV